jgi:hypothetical protein
MATKKTPMKAAKQKDTKLEKKQQPIIRNLMIHP